MPSSTCNLPNGHSFSVSAVFGGVTFKSNDLNTHHSAFPPGWTIVIHTEREVEQPSQSHLDGSSTETTPDGDSSQKPPPERKVEIHRFTQPTLSNDCLFISSITSPSNEDYKPRVSPSRQIALMLWATLWWYFHEPEPNLTLTTEQSAKTPEAARPKGEWRVNVKREGVFKSRNILAKMERMGLVATENSSVGLDQADLHSSGLGRPDFGERMFTSRRAFWQLDPRIFLFSMTPTNQGWLSNPPSPSMTPSPHGSRPASPHRHADGALSPGEQLSQSHSILSSLGPYNSSSHLPTYYPPAPTQYVVTDGVRHPLRPRPPHQGETFYTRYIPRVGQYLSFRVPVLHPPKALPHHMHSTSHTSQLPSNVSSALSVPASTTPPPGGPSTPTGTSSTPVTDLDYLHKWMNDPRINYAWGEAGPRSHQENFLRAALTSRHSFPVIGCWDGRPFGYFEIYWVKEDRLGRFLAGNSTVTGPVDNYDRGLHVLVGEEEYRGPQRVPIWLSALVHCCWLADSRTQTVVLEPRVDNVKLRKYCEDIGFFKEGEVAFPHKQSNVLKIRRDAWESPVL